MDEKKQKLIELLDKAIRLAEGKREKYEITNPDEEFLKVTNLTIRNLKKIRENVSNGILEHSKGATLGLTRNIGEWCDDELFDVAHEIDHYFKEEMK